MTSVLTRDRRGENTTENRLHEDGSRGWGDAPTSQGTPGAARGWGRRGRVLSESLWSGHYPTSTLILTFWLLELHEKALLLL